MTQIPALIISTATGIIVTRAATDAQLGNEISRQVAAFPKSLIMVCCGLAGLLLLKGIPTMPVLTLLLFFAASARVAFQSKQKEPAHQPIKSLYETIKINPIELHLHKTLCDQLGEKDASFATIMRQLREYFAQELGFIIPEISLSIDDKLKFPFFYLSIQGNQQGLHELHLDKTLAIATANPNNRLALSIEVKDPSYGLPAFWVNKEQTTEAQNLGYTLCEPWTVLHTYLREVIQNNIAELLTRSETEQLLAQPGLNSLRDELIPGLISLSTVQRILQNLLQEHVSIRPLSLILEVLIEQGKTLNCPNLLTEVVRSRLATPICQKLSSNQKQMAVLTLAHPLEQKLHQGLKSDNWALEPSFTEAFMQSLITQVESMLKARKRPILLCANVLRKPIKQLTQRIIPHLTVLAMSEVPVNFQVESFAIVE